MKRFVNFSPDPLANRNVNFQYAACSSQEKCKARAGGGSTGGGGEVDARWRRGGWRTRRRRLALAQITSSALPLAEMALVVADVAGGMKEAEAREAEATAERSWSARASRRRRDGTVRRWLRDLREVAEIGRTAGACRRFGRGSNCSGGT